MRDFKICKGCFSQFYLENNSSLLIRNLQYHVTLLFALYLLHQEFCRVQMLICWYSVRFPNIAPMYCTFIFSFTRIHQQVYPTVRDDCGQARTYVGRTDWFRQNQGRSTNHKYKNFQVSKISLWSCDKSWCCFF